MAVRTRGRWVQSDAGILTPTSPALVTIHDVEILEVGEDWETSTGLFTWDVEDLQSAIASQDDPSIRTPILKLGHVDPRPGFDGQPAFGRLVNLRLKNNLQTLTCDLAGVPSWLAAVMPTAYPRRSIEGWFDYEARSGQTWPFILTGLALLGEAYPAINTLEDLAILWGDEAPELVPVDDLTTVVASQGNHICAARSCDVKWIQQRAAAASATDDLTDPQRAVSATEGEDLPMPKPRQAQAAVSFDDLRMSYYEYLDENEPGSYWWWIREVRIQPAELIVDDDEGSLWRVTYTIGTDDEITFGDKVEVKIEYLEVAAAADGGQSLRVAASAKGQRVVARWVTPEEAGRKSKPADASTEGTTPPAGSTTDTPPAPSGTTPEGGSTTDPSGSATVPSSGSGTTPGGIELNIDEAAVRQALGLPDTATSEEIQTALLARLANPTPTGDGATTEPGQDGNPASQPNTPSDAPTGEPATAPGTGDGATVPGTDAPSTTPSTDTAPANASGTVTVDKAAWDETQAFITQQRAEAAKAAEAERDRIIAEAVREGKFPRARVEHYTNMWKADPVGARQTIASLTPGLVPVAERGVVGGETDPGTSESAYADWMKPAVSAASRAQTVRAGGPRITSANDQEAR